jgi:hypothetical protein
MVDRPGLCGASFRGPRSGGLAREHIPELRLLHVSRNRSFHPARWLAAAAQHRLNGIPVLKAWNFIRASGRCLLLLTIVGVTAEIAARADDWWFQGVPFFATPSYNDLFMVDETGLRRGKPNAHFQKWQMNSFGFRSPEMTRLPDAGTHRVVLLGASEAFGLYESPGNDIAAQLNKLGRPYGMEVVNAALPGITVATLDNYWRGWASQFNAETVVIYPSTHLYVSCEDWSGSPGGEGMEARGLSITSLRLFERAKNVIAQPAFLVRRRNGAKVAAEVARHSSDWVYQSVPRGCVDRLIADLSRLVEHVRASRANIVLSTHAIRVSRQPGEEDLRDLDSFRVFSPRAPASVMNEFVSEANAAIRRLAREQHLELADIEQVMRGRREDFEDLVHFNDHGAHAAAEAMLPAIRRAQEGREGSSP